MPFVAADVDKLRYDWEVVEYEANFYGPNLKAVIAKAGGEQRIKSCGRVFTGTFQVPSVAWRLHLHLNEAEIFPFGPGTALSMGSTPLSVDPRYPDLHEDPALAGREHLRAEVTWNPWRPSRRARPRRSARACRHARSSRSRPGSPRSSCSRSSCARASSGSASGSTRGCRSGSPTARSATSPTRCGSTARRRSTTCCCTSGWRVAGSSEEAVRWLSVACTLLAVPVAWWAAAGLLGTRAGWMAAVLAATNPFLTQYAQEGRMYALVALLALVASAAFARAFARGRRGWAIAYAVVLAAMLYTHNWALFFGAACGLVWLYLLWRSEERRETLILGAIAFGGALALYLPWIPTTLYQAAHTGAPWSESPTVVALLGTPVTMLGQFASVALLLAAGAGLAVLLRRPGRSPAAWLLAIALLTVTLAWMSSQLSPAWANRYLAVAAAPLLLAVAAGLAHAGRLGIAGLIVAALLGIGDTAPDDKSNVREVARTIAPSLRAGDLVIATQPEQVAGARLLPARGRALRDAHRRRGGHRASPTGATAPSGWGRPRPSATSRRCSTSSSPGSAWRW